MKIRRWQNSEHCFLHLKIRIPYIWVEQLELLVEISELRNIEELIKTLMSWQLMLEEKNINNQRDENIRIEKEIQEYWKYKWADV